LYNLLPNAFSSSIVLVMLQVDNQLLVACKSSCVALLLYLQALHIEDLEWLASLPLAEVKYQRLTNRQTTLFAMPLLLLLPMQALQIENLERLASLPLAEAKYQRLTNC
jgi:hypothetical protein